MSRAREVFGTVLIGVALGYLLSRIGFSSWDQVHDMFTFADLRMTLVFGLGVAILVPTWIVIRRVQGVAWPKRTIHKGTLAGGVLFGVGWAICGACPSIAFVQIGEGQFAALVTILGVLIGNYGYSVLHERFFRWDTGSCLDE